jgi:hypothetical protein
VVGMFGERKDWIKNIMERKQGKNNVIHCHTNTYDSNSEVEPCEIKSRKNGKHRFRTLISTRHASAHHAAPGPTTA